MNAHTRLFKLNRSQAVRLPKSVAFPEGVDEVIVRRVGNSIIITPVNAFWDDFFDGPPTPDFPPRSPQGEYDTREAF